MRFVLSEAPMHGVGQTLNDLDAIILRVEDAVHELEVLDADKLDATEWYASSRYDRKRLLEEIAGESLRSTAPSKGPHSIRVPIDTASDAAVGRILAYTPLDVLLENSVSDGALVTAAIRVFGNEETRQLCFGAPSKLAPPAFRFESWGGEGELRKLISSKVAEAKARGVPPRLVVVTDSDGEWVGDVKKHAVDIRTICVQNGVVCPPLTQRTAENYIPDEVWSACADEQNGAALKPIVAALLRLSPEQRDYVRLEKSGTPPWDRNKPEVAALFANVSTEDYETLTKASLKGKGDNMRILSLLAYQEVLTAHVLRTRDRNNDLSTIVEHIENAL